MMYQFKKCKLLRTTIAMIVGMVVMLPSFTFAEPQGATLEDTSVAAIGDVHYETVQDAVDAAGAGDTVQLLHDVTENVKLNDKNLTLDLAGHTMEAVAPDYTAVAITGGNVTVKNGILTNGRGTLKVAMNNAWGARQPVTGTRRGNITAENATLVLEDMQLTRSVGNALATKNCTLTITNSDIFGNNGNGAAVAIIEGGTASIKNTTISGNTGASDTVAVVNGANAVFDGCSISGNAGQYTGGVLVGAAIAEPYKADVTLKNTAITGNTSNNTLASAGGLCVWYGTIRTENSTIADNRYLKATTYHRADDVLIKRWLAGSQIQKADTMPGGYSNYAWVDNDEKAHIDALTFENIEISTATTFSLGFTAERIETDAVATYNGAAYTSLSKAVSAAVADNANDRQDKKVTLLKDTKDNVSVADSVTFIGTLEIDLNGKTVQPKKAVNPIFQFQCGGDGTVHVHDGKIEGATLSGSRTGGGLVFDTDVWDERVSNLVVENVDFENNCQNQLYIRTLGTVELRGCNFTGSGQDQVPGYGVRSELASDEIISNCTFTNGRGAIYARSQQRKALKLLVEDTVVQDNVITAEGDSNSLIYFDGYVGLDVTMRAVTISNNSSSAAYTPASMLFVEGDRFAPGSITVEDCVIADNNAGYGSGTSTATSSTVLSKHANWKIKGTRIERNRAARVGGFFQNDTGQNCEVVLEDSVITENLAAGTNISNYATSGGLCIMGKLTAKGDVAIYDNTVETVHPAEYKANDLRVAKNASIVYEETGAFISAKDMKDGAVDFSEKIWKDGAVSVTEEVPAKSDTQEVRYYTVIEDKERYVAQVGDEKYVTVQAAIDAANPGDTVELISEELHVDTPTLEITKDITIACNGRNLRLDRTALAITVVEIKNDATVTILNTPDANHDEGGIKRGTVRLSDNASLTVSDPVNLPSVVHEGAELRLNAVLEGTVHVTLGNEKYITLGDAWKDGVDHEKTTIEITLSPTERSAVNAGATKKIVANGDEKLFRSLQIPDIAATVKKKMDGNDIILTTPRAVYLSGSGLNSNSGLSPTSPVATFDRARSILLSDPQLEGIYIVGTVYTNSRGETWSMPEGESRPIMRYGAFTGYLIQAEGNFTLENITIDGQKDQMEEGSFSLIKVRQGKLTLGDGAELCNNNGANPNINHHGQHTVHGGAVMSENISGSVEMLPGSRIHDNEAFFGGGIFIGSSTFNMKGGIIENNRAIDYPEIREQFYNWNEGGAGKIYPNPTGGGVMVAFGATMNMEEGAVIRGNVADEWGGGICLGNNLQYYGTPGMYETSGKIVTFNMNGGTIEGNMAQLNGGGLFVQGYTVAHIYEGKINNNAVGTGEENVVSELPRGGAIYVNRPYWKDPTSSGKLYFHNPTELAYNKAGSGGAINVSLTGETIMRDYGGFVIHDNESDKGGQIHQTEQRSADDRVSRRCYISEYMPGGGEYNWKSPTTGNAAPVEDLHFGAKPQAVTTALDADSTEIKEALKKVKIYINGNRTYAGGGAIANSGYVEIGTGFRTVTYVTATKEWDDAGKESGRPTHIILNLYRDDELFKQVTVRPDSTGTWTYTFIDLPRYKVDPATDTETTDAYTYRVEEDRGMLSQTSNVTYEVDETRGQDTEIGAAQAVTPTSSTDLIKVQNWTVTNKAVELPPTPEPLYTITYDLNGGNFDGDTSSVVEKYKMNTKIRILRAPVREGYTFLYWEGSIYDPGDAYTVKGDHTFTAKWKKAGKEEKPDDPPPGGDPDDPDKPGTEPNKPGTVTPATPTQKEKPAATGDGAPVGIVVGLAALALLVMLAMPGAAQRCGRDRV